MARGRSRVSSYGRSQTAKGVGASRSFGQGFSKLAGGVADVVSGVAQAGSQAADAAVRSFNRPTVTPVRSSAPGTLTGTPAPTAPVAPAASTGGSSSVPAVPVAAKSTVPLPPRRGDGNAPAKASVAPSAAATTASPTATGDTYSGGRNKAAFDAAFNKAREMGGSTARFKFGDKEYQAAKSKDEYVSSSKQNAVDIGDLSKNVAPAAPATSTSTPADTTNSTASVTTNDQEKKAVPTPPRRPAGLQESVTVGDNKYRIV